MADRKTDHSPSPSSQTSQIRLPPFDHSLSEDEKVVHKFLETIQTKMDQGLFGTLQENEKALLLQPIMYPGIYIGSLTAVASFVFLRKTPLHIINRYFIPYYNHPSSIFVKVKYPSEMPSSFTEPKLLQPFTLMIDALLSSIVGLTTWITFTDKQKIYDAMTEIPLLQGRSTLSDVLCDDFIHLYHREIPKSFWQEYEDDILTTISRIVQNCEKRRAFEHKIRQGQDISIWSEFSVEKDDSQSEFISLPTKVPKDILEPSPLESMDQDDVRDWAEADDFQDDMD